MYSSPNNVNRQWRLLKAHRTMAGGQTAPSSSDLKCINIYHNTGS